jgi:adenylate cyclase
LENAALYANLEQKVEERTRELQLTNELLDAERDRTEKLLLNVLPAGIVERLKKGETTIADRTDDVSVLFADIANFTHYAATRSAEDVIQLLNNVFNTFDDLVTKYGVEKIKTIGDAYMVVSGVPHYRADHAEALALLAHDMHKAVPVIREQNSLPELGIRIGVHTGPVIAGVIGRSKFSFDLWGDTVNVAARMESHGRIGSIHASEDFVRSLQQQSQHQWLIEERGMVDVKGRGKVRTFWINGG